MICGRFGNTTTAPYVEGRLSIPRFGIRANISLLIDTGADSTVLMPQDGIRVNLPYSALQNVGTATGVGGSATSAKELAFLGFYDTDGFIIAYQILLTVLLPTPASHLLPSLLGRDVINQWKLVCDQTNGIVTGEVRSYFRRAPAALSP